MLFYLTLCKQYLCKETMYILEICMSLHFNIMDCYSLQAQLVILNLKTVTFPQPLLPNFISKLEVRHLFGKQINECTVNVPLIHSLEAQQHYHQVSKLLICRICLKAHCADNSWGSWVHLTSLTDRMHPNTLEADTVLYIRNGHVPYGFERGSQDQYSDYLFVMVTLIIA